MLSSRVHNKNNPIKYGIKSYILCDSDIDYCYGHDVYVTESLSLEQTVCRLLGYTCLSFTVYG